MTTTMPRPRANTARREGIPGTRVGYVPAPAPEPFYLPNRGGHFANRRIAQRPQTILCARQRVAEWLAAADPRTAPAFTYMADYWGALNDHIEAHGEMHLFLRYNH